MTIEEICAELDTLRLPHYICEEDCWYTCPANNCNEDATKEYHYTCCNEQAEDGDFTCNCGADTHNAKIDQLKDRLRSNGLQILGKTP